MLTREGVDDALHGYGGVKLCGYRTLNAEVDMPEGGIAGVYGQELIAQVILSAYLPAP